MTFMECDECAAKPGTPVLCDDCLKRRSSLIREAKPYTGPNPFASDRQPTLYILMRTDLASMNPGKAMAQAAHAANAFIRDVGAPEAYPVSVHAAVEEWEESTPQGFGTTITLAVESEVAMCEAVLAAQEEGFPAGVINDPTYPLRDGYVTHLLDINTCAYVFTTCRVNDPVSALDGIGLHP